MLGLSERKLAIDGAYAERSHDPRTLFPASRMYGENFQREIALKLQPSFMRRRIFSSARWLCLLSMTAEQGVNETLIPNTDYPQLSLSRFPGSSNS